MKKGTLLGSLAFIVILFVGSFASFGSLENYQHGVVFVIAGILNIGISGYAARCAYNAIRAKFDNDFKNQ